MTKEFYCVMGALDSLISFLTPQQGEHPLTPPEPGPRLWDPRGGDKNLGKTATAVRNDLKTIYETLEDKARAASKYLAVLNAAHSFPDLLPPKPAPKGSKKNKPSAQTQKPATSGTTGPSAFPETLDPVSADPVTQLLNQFENSREELWDYLHALKPNFPRLDPGLVRIIDELLLAISLSTKGGGGEGAGYWPSIYSSSSSSGGG